MAITFEREQQATIQAYHRNRHDPRIKDLGVDTVLDMVRIFRIRKYWFYRYLSWARYGWSWASNFFYPEHHLGWCARISNFCGATRPTSRLVKITSQKNLRIFMQLGCCVTQLNQGYHSALSGVVRIEIWSSFSFCVSSFWATARPACEWGCLQRVRTRRNGAHCGA